MISNDNHQADENSADHKIVLLEEKLKIARKKQKIGEVIIRKEVETKTVNIPLRREKLIIEKIGKNPEKLSEVILSSETVNGFQYDEVSENEQLHFHQSSYISLQQAQKLLSAINQLSLTKNLKISLELVTICAEDQAKLSEICDRFNIEHLV